MPPEHDGSLLIGTSPHVRELRLLARRLADWPGHASVVGPTGVGKALFASEVFRHLTPGTYRRRSVATEHEDLVEGQWLGWVKGAFTGAVTDHPGLLGLMAHGHVFLDEVQLIHTQPKLRRILLDAAEGEELYRLGATRPYPFAGGSSWAASGRCARCTPRASCRTICSSAWTAPRSSCCLSRLGGKTSRRLCGTFSRRSPR